jgi:hypothetical protein
MGIVNHVDQKASLLSLLPYVSIHIWVVRCRDDNKGAFQVSLSVTSRAVLDPLRLQESPQPLSQAGTDHHYSLRACFQKGLYLALRYLASSHHDAASVCQANQVDGI